MPFAGRAGETGYLLFGVLILLFLFTLALSIAAPLVAKDIQRDKEEEAVQRGKQYKRAIRMYYKKYNAYPTTMAQLESTNNLRFLRKRYLDPMTGKDDWRLIHVGEAKVPVMGFFGQPLQAGTSSTTTGLMGNGTGSTANGSNASGASGGFGSSAGSSFGGSSFGSSSGTTGDGSVAAAPVGVLPGMSAGAGTGSGTAGSTDGSGATGAPSGSTAGFGTSAASQSTAIGSGSTGPIVGVGIAVDKPSLVIYHKQDRYNKWEFTYDPIEEQILGSGGSSIPGAAAAAGSGTGTSTGSSTTGGIGGTGTSTGSSTTGGTGSGSGFGSSTDSGSTPASPSNDGSSPNPN